MKGTRVQAVVRELNNERIDIVPWSSDPSVFVTQALRPAEVAQVNILNIEEKKMRVVVEDDQLSLAIGKAGQNARLAVKLTGWDIDLIKRSDLERQLMEETFGAPIGDDEDQISDETNGIVDGDDSTGSLNQLDGVSTKIREKLVEAGFSTLESLQKASKEDLTSISGIGAITADKILSGVK